MGRWNQRFLDLAKMVASWSKDPSTKVGAVAVGTARQVVETGFNGLPRGVRDIAERMMRPEKYLWTSHAEENLVAHAARAKLEGATVYTTHLCCNACARMLINAGVAKVICDGGKTAMPREQFDVAVAMFKEAGVELVLPEPQVDPSVAPGQIGLLGGECVVCLVPRPYGIDAEGVCVDCRH